MAINNQDVKVYAEYARYKSLLHCFHHAKRFEGHWKCLTVKGLRKGE